MSANKSQAIPLETKVVKGELAIHVKGATYANTAFSGTLLISKNENLPLERTGKHLVQVDCQLEGDDTQAECLQFLVDMDTAEIHKRYDGAVRTKIKKYNP